MVSFYHGVASLRKLQCNDLPAQARVIASASGFLAQAAASSSDRLFGPPARWIGRFVPTSCKIRLMFRSEILQPIRSTMQNEKVPL